MINNWMTMQTINCIYKHIHVIIWHSRYLNVKRKIIALKGNAGRNRMNQWHGLRDNRLEADWDDGRYITEHYNHNLIESWVLGERQL